MNLSEKMGFYEELNKTGYLTFRPSLKVPVYSFSRVQEPMRLQQGHGLPFGVLDWVFIHLANASSEMSSPILLRSALSFRI